MRRVFSALLLLAAMGCASGASADNCLKRPERQAAINSGQAVRLNVALGPLWAVVKGRVVRAKLCSGGNGLTYRVRVLEPSGRMRFALIDAKTGQILSLK